MKTTIGLLLILLSTLLTSSKILEGYELGDYAADFSLKNVDGKTISMSDYPDAKGFILSFTCNSCPYAQMYEQRIINLHNKYALKGYPVIAINPNDPDKSPGDSFDKMKERSSEKDYPFPYLLDENQEVAKKYGATNTPHMYILERDNNKFKVVYIGTIDNNPKDPEKATKHYIDDAMNALMSDEEIEVSKTKAVGCTIKWKSSS